MTRIDELNAALAAANLGEAEVWPENLRVRGEHV